MAFLSIDTMRKFSRNDAKSPTVTFRRTGNGYITQAVFDGPKQPTIDVQIDMGEKKVRLRTGENLSRKLIGRVGHTFGFPRKAADEVIPKEEKAIRIKLEKGDDGWWYGSYEAQEKETAKCAGCNKRGEPNQKDGGFYCYGSDRCCP
ncbi:hypothetical protein [Serratia quinivorans]|uniref:hypothetical protein n=1 Tax=Serratia quinivorans TaxID=137545 RepID=UPI002179C4EA|nr:hypothetical protein [Serratia quinivorans]CAI0910867.1 Uncharacterised protein [Serratia quinivorans]